MVVYITAMSALEHILFYTMALFLNRSSDRKLNFLIGAIANFFICLKHASNFFIFFYFNKAFASYFKSKIK